MIVSCLIKRIDVYGDGTFKPTADITREQLAAILYRYPQSKGQGFEDEWMFLLDYPDAAEISDWADEAMHWCVINGIINGKDGNPVPKGDASRAVSVTMALILRDGGQELRASGLLYPEFIFFCLPSLEDLDNRQ